MSANVLVVQYSTSTAFASNMIRRLCHSPFSHVDIVLPHVGLLGASGPDKTAKAIVNGVVGPDPGGVQIRPFDPWPYLNPPLRASLKTDKADKIIELAKSQIGKPFDDSALYGFLSSEAGERDWREQDKWFCSELVTWACEAGGMFPYPLVALKNRVSPADSLLLFNPFMTPDNIAIFTGMVLDATHHV